VEPVLSNNVGCEGGRGGVSCVAALASVTVVTALPAKRSSSAGSSWMAATAHAWPSCAMGQASRRAWCSIRALQITGQRIDSLTRCNAQVGCIGPVAAIEDDGTDFVLSEQKRSSWGATAV
jgi:hypothetical protein